MRTSSIEDELAALLGAELELRVGDDDAARLGVRDGAAVDGQREVAEPGRQRCPTMSPACGFADVLVVAGLGLRRRREDGRGQAVDSRRPSGSGWPQTAPVR